MIGQKKRGGGNALAPLIRPHYRLFKVQSAHNAYNLSCETRLKVYTSEYQSLSIGFKNLFMRIPEDLEIKYADMKIYYK